MRAHVVLTCEESTLRWTVQKQAVNEFKSEQLMNQSRGVPFPSQVIRERPSDRRLVQVGPRQTALTQQCLLEILAESVSIPDAKLGELVPAQEQPVELEA